MPEASTALQKGLKANLERRRYLSAALTPG